jgi:hypothetical protein
MADSALPDPFEFLKKLWAPMGLPLATAMPGIMFPTTNQGEIDKRIGELRAVEGWLALNLEMVRTTMQGLEAQKATLAAFQAMQQSAAAAVAPSAPPPRKSKTRKAG